MLKLLVVVVRKNILQKLLVMSFVWTIVQIIVVWGRS